MNAYLTAAIYGATDDGAKIISMSLGQAYGLPNDLKAAMDYAISKGVLIVASSGNDYAEVANWPAAYAPVISVAASTKYGVRANFSTYHASVDIAAPGEAVSCVKTGGYGYCNGTSFSAPLVAGAAAVVWRVNPDLPATEIGSLLTRTARDVSPAGKDIYTGSGIVDVTAALADAKAVTPHTQLLLTPDMTGDGRGEVLGKDKNGALWIYAGKSDGTLQAGLKRGKGFGAHTLYAPGDWNSDGKADLISVNAAGQMFLFTGSGGGVVKDVGQIGKGWTGYRVVPCGDMDGDKNTDLLAIDSKGLLWLYSGDGKGKFKAGRKQVGKGWIGYELYAAGDLTKDGKADILSIDSTGKLFLYRGIGDGRFKTREQVGKGWIGYTLVAGADIDGDKVSDIVGRDSAGNLFFYKGKGGGLFAAKKQIGKGW
jgi:hypothetical protein